MDIIWPIVFVAKLKHNSCLANCIHVTRKCIQASSSILLEQTAWLDDGVEKQKERVRKLGLVKHTNDVVNMFTLKMFDARVNINATAIAHLMVCDVGTLISVLSF